MKKLLFSLFALMSINCFCQVGKMSSLVREASRCVAQVGNNTKLSSASRQTITAFVKADNAEALSENGCRVYACWDDLYIASIPLNRIHSLASSTAVHRIEAGLPMTVENDTCAAINGARQVWQGGQLPQAFRGSGVVVGVMDIGFDYTHPTFSGRIRKVWDMMTPDTVGSDMPVGRVYDESELPSVQHSYDGLLQTHGTHTAATAAGSGFEGKYSGMAPESDIVMVANYTSNNQEMIDSLDRYKYTDALDILGFKFMFDYAESQGKPCVASFSEGSAVDLLENDLRSEALDRLVGPGRIIVASAGNQGEKSTYVSKAHGQTTLRSSMQNASADVVGYIVRSNRVGDNIITLKDTTVTYTAQRLMECDEHQLCDTIVSGGDTVEVELYHYMSCYDDSQNVYGVVAYTNHIDLEFANDDPDADAIYLAGEFSSGNTERSHSIHAPSCYPSVISVGAVGYRPGVYNYRGQWKHYYDVDGGKLAPFSSVGPSLTGDIKPDIVAPGNNVVSAYSSFYIENNPRAGDLGWDVEHFDYNGRTYAWNSNSGTSMSTPVVSGCIALWLQAKPDLTREEIIDIFAHTSRHYDPLIAYPNNCYGHGEIDAYRGLLYLLGIDGIVTPRLLPSSVFPLREGETMHIYTIDGKSVKQMGTGIYAIQIESNDPSRCGSMIVGR